MTQKDFYGSLKYINELVGCMCFPDLLSLKIFPDGKEVTESASIYAYIRKHQKDNFPFGDANTVFIAVGDGSTPRTASMFAFRSQWQCFSVDPALKWRNNGRVGRLNIIPKRVEQLPNLHFDKLVIAAVHSHANLKIVADKFTANKRLIIAMPCCVSQDIGKPPTYEFVDNGVWSTKNRILVWED